MPRYIDADALLKKQTTIRVTYHCQGADEWDDYEVVLVKDINNAPTVTPDDVRGVGGWEDAKQHGLCRCSVCKDCYIEKDYITQAKWNYCPNCGTRMMEVSEDA